VALGKLPARRSQVRGSPGRVEAAQALLHIAVSPMALSLCHTQSVAPSRGLNATSPEGAMLSTRATCGVRSACDRL